MNDVRGGVFIVCLLLIASSVAAAAEQDEKQPSEGENASNPLAKVKNTDVRWQYWDIESGKHVNRVVLEGAFMAHDKLKIKYELNFWETDLSGSNESDWESVKLTSIFFPHDGIWGDVKYRLAFGCDWIEDLGDRDKAIGSGSDQLGPFIAVALGLKDGMMVIPLLQQFIEYSGEDVSTTAFRLITLKPLPQKIWLKLDTKIPIEWENSQNVPATAELQLGKSLNKHFGLYVDTLVGIGSDRPYDWGIGLGVRIMY